MPDTASPQSRCIYVPTTTRSDPPDLHRRESTRSRTSCCDARNRPSVQNEKIAQRQISRDRQRRHLRLLASGPPPPNLRTARRQNRAQGVARNAPLERRSAIASSTRIVKSEPPRPPKALQKRKSVIAVPAEEPRMRSVPQPGPAVTAQHISLPAAGPAAPASELQNSRPTCRLLVFPRPVMKATTAKSRAGLDVGRWTALDGGNCERRCPPARHCHGVRGAAKTMLRRICGLTVAGTLQHNKQQYSALEQTSRARNRGAQDRRGRRTAKPAEPPSPQNREAVKPPNLGTAGESALRTADRVCRTEEKWR
ncbi:hypothetical protein CERSUDRAFT_100942 [Gelatoporia subvermispora B]|uniref:Uncharacterized protein n=1 Tax=Ceriporiopsis subvermispora (strain B) TaxID=914234 RepID=M2QY19_CERS8|nr:hypothetical protein CERSUDRAFT_100942 [Gelatoporia subvermispora B]